MTHEPDHIDRPDDDALAGEYALGLLVDEELAAAQERERDDPAFAALVEDWHARLGELHEEVAPVEPPARLWRRIETALLRDGPARASLWQSLAFWRWSTLSAGLVALASLGALALVVLVPPEQPDPLQAMLRAPDAGAVFMASLDPSTGSLVIKAAGGDGEADRVPELWLIPQDGVPRSLGVIDPRRAERLLVPEPLMPHARPGSTLAITMEPPGGAPEGKPTGQVIASGEIGEL